MFVISLDHRQLYGMIQIFKQLTNIPAKEKYRPVLYDKSKEEDMSV